jgi:hypothetical protein
MTMATLFEVRTIYQTARPEGGAPLVWALIFRQPWSMVCCMAPASMRAPLSWASAKMVAAGRMSMGASGCEVGANTYAFEAPGMCAVIWAERERICAQMASWSMSLAS